MRAEWSANTLRVAGLTLFGAAVVLENVTSLRDVAFVTPNALLGVSICVLASAYIIKRHTKR